MSHLSFSTWTRVARPLFLVLLATVPVLAATPPAFVNYQGVLRDNNDKPLSGAYDMVFRFMDAATGGNEIMTDQHAAATSNEVIVSGGLFNSLLGSGTVMDGIGPGTYTSLDAVFRDYGSVWLEIRVGAETLSPRTRIQSAAYALNATNAVSATNAVNAMNAVNATNATTAADATALAGLPASSYLTTGPEAQTKTGALRLEYGYGGSNVLEVISHDVPALVVSNDAGLYRPTCQLGAWPDNPISCTGHAQGGHFATEAPYYAYANIPYGTTGIEAWGPNQGAVFGNFSTSAYANIAASSYKIVGTGSVSFVQNHPADPSKVIVYAAPEGDEVAVYTRGSGRLVDGEAHVLLGETFALVANPDIGLTATVTPTGELIPLTVVEKGTRELVVRGPAGSSAAFDYLVWGLRIGFEEQSIVQPKERDSRIPAMAAHEKFFAAEPALRSYTALARFKSVEASVARREKFDFTRADKLRDAVGVSSFRAGNAPPPEGWRDASALVGSGGFQKPIPPGQESRPAALPTRANLPAAPLHPAPGAASVSPDLPAPADTATIEERRATSIAGADTPDYLIAEGIVEPGDVLSLDAASPGSVLRAAGAGDPLVVGCAREVEAGASSHGQVAIATSHVALCRVDATYGAVGVGDRLVSSPTTGAAMRADGSFENSLVLGRAIDPLQSGSALIRVLVGAK